MLLQPTAAIAAPAPNILIVLADDHGYGDVSCYNPESRIRTPHIDRLAAEGLRFTDAHSSSSVCTPTRYSLLTGRYHWRTRLQQGVLGGFSPPLIAAGRLTLAGLLRQHGYHTACFGKWHLGMDWPLTGGGSADDRGDFGRPFPDAARIDYMAPIRHGPLDRGFDHFFGISASLDMFPYVWIEDRRATEAATAEKAFPRAGPAGPGFEAVDVQPGIIDRVLAYVRARAPAARKGTPFFAYVALAAPHTPILPTPESQGKSGLNAYADFVLQVDVDVGRILAALEELKLAGNTLVVFTSDNGCSPAAGFDEMMAAGHRPSHTYRGHKADIYEGGHRIPFVARWPAKVKPGRVTDRLVGQLDFMATFAGMLEIALPPDAAEDSVSFLPVLLDREDAPGRASLVSQSINGSFAIREGAWKLVLCPDSGGWSEPRPGTAPRSGQPPVQLYNLADDSGETTNLAETHPDRVAAMTEMMSVAIERGRTTPGPDQANDTDIVMIKPAPPRPRR